MKPEKTAGFDKQNKGQNIRPGTPTPSHGTPNMKNPSHQQQGGFNKQPNNPSWQSGIDKNRDKRDK